MVQFGKILEDLSKIFFFLFINAADPVQKFFSNRSGLNSAISKKGRRWAFYFLKDFSHFTKSLVY